MMDPHAAAGADDRRPAVSVVIPAHNAERTIARTLDSVAAQTFRDFEVVVCDDGSTDGTRAIVDAIAASGALPECRVLALTGRRAAGARNDGIRAARGEYVAFLDDDDSWAPEKLAECVAALRARSVDLVCHSEYWQDEAGGRQLRHYAELWDPRVPPVVSVMRNNPFSTSAVVVRRERLHEAGLFDESLPSAEDLDLWIRLVLLPGFRVAFLDAPLGTYLVRAGSESAKVDRRLRALLDIGDRYAPTLRTVHGAGRLEHWKFVGRTLFTSGIRFAQQGRRAYGVAMAVAGLTMWPFRWEWVQLAVRERRRRRALVGSAP